jgi:hypothetical protein
MAIGFEQYVGEKVGLVYMDENDEPRQCQVEILSIGKRCITAYCFDDHEPRLFNNEKIIGVMPGIRHIN